MKAVFLLILVCLLFLGCIRYLESISLFYPARPILATPKEIGLSFEEIFLTTTDHIRLNGWLVKALKAQGTILFFHGNAGNIGNRLEKIALFYTLNYHVFIIDYRGYGKSEGRPSEVGIYRDAVAAFDYLASRQDIDPKRIVAYGESLGGSVAVDLVTRRPLTGLILDSTFPSAVDMAQVVYPFIPSFLLKTKLDSFKKIRTLKIPKLFIHSAEDEIVPFALGKKLFEAAPEPKAFLTTFGTHNEGFRDSYDIYLEGIRKFLDHLEPT